MKFPPGYNDLFDERVALVEELLGKHVLPLFCLDKEHAPVFEGSCVPVRIGGRKILVSAGHVFDGTTDGGIHLLLRGREQQPLENPVRVTITQRPYWRDDDMVDLGFVALTSDEAAAIGDDAFLTLPNQLPLPIGNKYSRLVVFGYPGNRQERDNVNLAYNLKQTRFASPSIQLSKQKEAGLDDRHFAMNFDPRRIVAVKGGRGGKPNFRGMSGGGVWLMDPYTDYSPDNYPPFVGFLVGSPAKNKKILFGPRAAVLLELLATDGERAT